MSESAQLPCPRGRPALCSWRRAAAPARLFLCLALLLFVLGCQTDLYQGLTEEQANTMLMLLMKHGVTVEKRLAGKNGYVISVDDEQIVLALQILRDNSLPRDNFASLGSVFSSQGMISSPTEENSRLAFAISQELANTFSRIDGVLTARVHVVLAATDRATDTRSPASASVFLRHLPDSRAAGMVAKIRELTANAVPDLSIDAVSVMLVPVRDTLAVPMTATDGFSSGSGFPFFRTGVFLAAFVCAVGSMGFFIYSFVRSGRAALPPGPEGGGEPPARPDRPEA